jgi:AICAR transformylase/IMP cyclohydrolase PurH
MKIKQEKSKDYIELLKLKVITNKKLTKKELKDLSVLTKKRGNFNLKRLVFLIPRLF